MSAPSALPTIERHCRRSVEPMEAGPIYIGGLDRSGKTTLQAFLTSHPRIAIPGVGSNMWTYFYRRYGDLSRSENLERCLDAMLRYTHIRYLKPDQDRIRREFSRGPHTYAHLFSLFLIHFAEREGKPRWGAQTGLIERYVDQLFAAYPGAKVIHMVRDPRDRYEASLGLWPDGKGRAGGATARWNYSVRLAERHLLRHPRHYLVVRFEDLIRRPEDTLRAVCGFLGESFVSSMLMMSGAPERRERLMNRASATLTAGLLSGDFIGRFHNRISREELAFIQLHARLRMRKLGYEPVAMRLTTRDWARFAARTWPSQFARMIAWRGLELLQQSVPNLAPRRPDPRSIVAPGGDDLR
jgi:hypothetical protein